MKRGFGRILWYYRNSRYAKPIFWFLILFLAAGLLVVVTEYRSNSEFKSFFDGLWWSIVTLSTTGYGDKVPVTTPGRVVAILTILLGIAAMSFLSGVLASVFVDQNTKARRGLMDYKNLSEHFVVCGWKDNMREILTNIIEASDHQIDSESIIVVSNIDSDKVEELKEVVELRGLKFVRGDYFSESALQRANVPAAGKVLILADTLESGAASEVDSKTVMTVLTIKAMAKDVYVCAELLDKKYESYLKQAMCDEILYTRDFSMRMLASTSAINGMSHILYELVSHHDNASRLTTEDLPPAMINKTYGELKEHFHTQHNKVLLGVLENTGSANRMKIEALREAQKTSDVSRLVNNLQEVKTMEVNRPLLLPANDYVIQQYSRLIVLER
ncbi:MAG: NAD-binding protein [Spirochaetales bacterium]|nr:NAD-binding protein [Spirochaetales bacterium]MCF7938486.1 NAD-binding protein [Spirochaetales bacterium]